MLKIAIVGCGNHSHEAHGMPLARFAREYPGQIELVAACDIDPAKAERFQKDFGFARVYTDMDAMLAKESPDVVHCIVPPPLVPELSLKVMEKGIVCVVEKPLGVTRAGVERLLDGAKRTGTPHMVSVNRRFMPRLWRAVNWGRSMGNIEYMRCAMERYHRVAPDFFWGTGLHALDALIAIGGEVAAYSGSARVIGALDRPWFYVDLRFSSGATARLDVLPTTGQEEEIYDLYGESYSARIISYMRRGTSVKCWEKNVLTIDDMTTPDEPQDVYRGEYDEVKFLVAALNTGQPLRPTIPEVAVSQKICFDLFEKAGYFLNS